MSYLNPGNCLLTLLLMLPLASLAVTEHGNEPAGETNQHEPAGLRLSAAQRAAAGIRSEKIEIRDIAETITAPGEIRLNQYRTSQVTSRISAQVIERHARLGDRVKKGDPLVTLSSVALAEAQGQLLVADREWRRARKLGRKIISDKRYTMSQVNRQQAYAKVLAYGMTRSQVNRLLNSKIPALASGQFILLSPQDGTIIKDDFIIGEMIPPGRSLFEISDESVLWVEARFTPAQLSKVRKGASALVKSGSLQYPGKLIQLHHALDETTRTLAVRIAVDNPDDRLHAGTFVETSITSETTRKALVVPTDAVLRSPDGDWEVFLEQDDGRIVPHEVEIVDTTDGLSVIRGITPGTRVITRGAFFVQSEIAKSGFEIHNH